MKFLSGVVGLVVLCFTLILFSAFTVSTLWGWFLVPLGVQSIGLAHAYGVTLLFSILMGTRGLGEKSGLDAGLSTMTMGVVLNVLALLFGFIAFTLM